MLYSRAMAKTLFFVEAALFAALALLLPLLAEGAAAAFLLPAAISLIAPLACAAAVWEPATVLRALRSAFSPERPEEAEAGLYGRVLKATAAFSRLAAAAGLLFSLSAFCSAEPEARGFGAWTLLGLYMAAYALLNAMLLRCLAEAVARLARPAPAAAGEAEEAFAAAHGLTPRELEAALAIAGGRSYKEAAYELGISLRTVKAHMGKVYEKTGAASNVALALLLREEGPIVQKSNGAEGRAKR